jgi:hypothetical protein
VAAEMAEAADCVDDGVPFPTNCTPVNAMTIEELAGALET